MYLAPSRPCNFSHHSIPATNVSYTSRSKLPEYSSGGLIFNLVHATIESSGHLPDSLLVRCIACTLLDHDSHDLLMGIPKQFLLLAINTSRYLVQLFVPAGSFALAFPHTILAYRLWHNFYAFLLPLVS